MVSASLSELAPEQGGRQKPESRGENAQDLNLPLRRAEDARDAGVIVGSDLALLVCFGLADADSAGLMRLEPTMASIGMSRVASPHLRC
jgi:hypothetical protein